MDLRIPWELFILASILVFITIFFAPVPFSPVGKAIYFDAPIAIYNFDNGTAQDSSGNGLDGTVYGNPVFVDTPYERGLSFNGSSGTDYVLRGDSPLFDSQTFTVEAWIKPNGDPNSWAGVHTIASKERQFILRFSGDDLYGYVFQGSMSFSPVSLHGEFFDWQASSWHHVALVFDGSYLRLYVNGNEESYQVVNDSITYSAYPFLIGNHRTWEGNIAGEFDGVIDEVIISNYAKTSFDITIPPTAEAGGPYTAKVNNSFTLSGDGYDDEAINSISFQCTTAECNWSCNLDPDLYPNPLVTGIGTSHAHINAVYICSSSGEHEFTLTATDNDALTATDTATVTISANIPPTADAGGPYEGQVNEDIVVYGTGTDSDGDITNIYWTDEMPCSVFNETPVGIGSSNASITAVINCPNEGTYLAELVVTDDSAVSVTDRADVIVTALPPNEPPTVDTHEPLGGYEGEAGLDIELHGSASDNDGTIDIIEWSTTAYQCQLWNDSTPGIGSANADVYSRINCSTEGTYAVTLSATDDDDATAEETIYITVNAPVNNPPTAYAHGPYSGEVNTDIQLNGSGTDDGTIQNISWSTTSSGCTLYQQKNYFGSTATNTGTIKCNSLGTKNIRLTVTDDDGLQGVDDTTVNVICIPPAKPTGLSAVAESGRVLVSWSEVANAYNYKLGKRREGLSEPSIFETNNNSYTDGAVTNGVTYCYSVAACKQLCCSSFTSEACATPSALGTPPSISYFNADAGDAEVELSWSASGNNVRFKLERKLGSTGTYSTIFSNSTLNGYLDEEVVNGNTYYYRLTASNADGSDSEETYATPELTGTRPTITSFNPIEGDSTVELIWTVMGTQPITYNLSRKVEGSPTYSAILIDFNETTYTDTGLTNNRVYSYKLEALNAFGSDEETIPATPHIGECGNGELESGEACEVAEDCTEARTQCDLVNKRFGERTVSCTECECDYGSWSYSYSNSIGSDYCINCQHCGDDECNCGETTDTCSGDCGTGEDLTPPYAPRNPKVTPGDGKVLLEWTENTETDLDKYIVYYGATSKVYDFNETTSNNYLEVHGLINGLKYFFAVKAVDYSGNASDFSREASATPEEEEVFPPTDLEVSISRDEVKLSWKHASPRPKHYDIYRDGEFLDSTSSNYYYDESAEAGQTYSYYLVSVSEEGKESNKSMTVEFEVPGKDLCKKDGKCNEEECERTEDPDCICNYDGVCEEGIENEFNCPDDCEEVGIDWVTGLGVGLIILAVSAVAAIIIYKKKKEQEGEGFQEEQKYFKF